jgi:putative ABC transport system permease protein
MTTRAIAGLPIDWQVQLDQGADAGAVAQALAATAPATAVETVEYARVEAFVADTGGTEQVTGPGQVVGIPDRYLAAFPGQLTPLVGRTDGPVLFSQTAANLHAGVGDSIVIRRPGLPDAGVEATGVAALPNVDSLFQAIGLTPGLAPPSSPPDNILIVPIATWHALFDAQRAVRPDSVRSQLHVRLDHRLLPGDPGAAYARVVAMANNLVARTAGSAVIGDNLAARLDGVRSDALYAGVTLLFLGAPGMLLAALLAGSIAAAGNARRRREQGLLRLRGAQSDQVLSRPAVEAAVAASAGGGAGVLLALALSAFLGLELSTATTALWCGIGALAALALGLTVVLLPAERDLRAATVAGLRAGSARAGKPLWQRSGLDLALIALAVILFLRLRAAGYQIVLATEGVAQTSVNYESFVAPLALWAGSGLLWIRLSGLLLASRRRTLGRLLAPLAGSLAGLVAASLSRQGRRLARGIGLLALATGFAVSTAIFNATYEAQARVDAELTNGADATVTGSAAAPAGVRLAAIRAVAGVAAAAPMMHRFAYVGADLQDLFGIDAAELPGATTLADAYFANHDATATLGRLAATPDGVLVSDETVRDFQLVEGDRINLRLQSALDHQYHVAPFRFVGTIREFPTAPRDSFLVANAGYVAGVTHDPSQEVVLVRAAEPAATVARLREALRADSTLRVTGLDAALSLISSSLTAVSLSGLTRIELGFAVLLMAAGTAIVIGLGFAERQRTYDILAALGANAGQIGSFLRSEALLITVPGLLCGLTTGLAVAESLVAMLDGVFDPPPDGIVVPFGYLAALLAAAAASSIALVVVFERLHRRADPARLRAG